MHTLHTPSASRLCRIARPLTPLILATRLRPAHRSSLLMPTLTNLLATVRNLHTTIPKNWGPLSMIHLSITLPSACRTPQLLKPRLLATSNSSSTSSSSKTTRPQSTPVMRHLKSRLPLLCPRSRTSSSNNNSNNPRIPTLPVLLQVPINLLHHTNLLRYPVQPSSNSIPPTPRHLPPQARESTRRTSLHRVVLARIQLPFIGN